MIELFLLLLVIAIVLIVIAHRVKRRRTGYQCPTCYG
jgi:hypothetical protein